MSNRAIRRARERERELGSSSALHEPSDDELPVTKQSMFALLGEAESGDQDNEEEEEAEGEVAVPDQVKESAASGGKKKKKKKKKKGKAVEGGVAEEVSERLGELDLVASSVGVGRDEVLRINAKNLDALHEVRLLFGSAALQIDGEGTGGLGRRAERAAMRGVRGGRGVRAPVSTRRNLFVRGNDLWPTGGSGGLGMEVVHQDNATGTTEFRFVHSPSYQNLQLRFVVVVESLGKFNHRHTLFRVGSADMWDAERLADLLLINTYHVATNLQLSLMAFQEPDFTVFADLIERALYTFGRAVHSTFASKIAEGKARLSFLRPENREFWLCCWRYIMNLSMRGIWRSAEEYARLLLSLDPEGDPYQMCLLIDLLALKARQPERFLALVEHDRFRAQFAHLPNIAYSTALAYQQLSQDTLAREYLAKAITRFPWVLRRLYVELSIRHDPKSPLASELPRPSVLQNLLCVLYVERTKDLWRAPQSLRLLAEVAETIHTLPKTRPSHLEASEREGFHGVNIDVARHVVMVDNPTVLSHVPKEWTRGGSLYYDPLAPSEQIQSYFLPTQERRTPEVGVDSDDASLLTNFLMNYLPRVAGGANARAPEASVYAERMRLAALTEPGIEDDGDMEGEGEEE